MAFSRNRKQKGRPGVFLSHLLTVALLFSATLGPLIAAAQSTEKVPVILHVSNSAAEQSIGREDAKFMAQEIVNFRELIGSGATVVDVKVASLEEIHAAVKRELSSGRFPGEGIITGVVLSGHGGPESFRLSKRVRYDGPGAATATAKGLKDLPLAPEIGVYLWACNCGSKGDSEGFSSRFAADIGEAFRGQGLASEVSTVLAHISLTDERVNDPNGVKPIDSDVLHLYSRFDTAVFNFVRNTIGRASARRVAYALPYLLFLRPVERTMRHTLRVLSIADGKVTVSEEHGLTALPRELGTACKAAL